MQRLWRLWNLKIESMECIPEFFQIFFSSNSWEISDKTERAHVIRGAIKNHDLRRIKLEQRRIDHKTRKFHFFFSNWMTKLTWLDDLGRWKIRKKNFFSGFSKIIIFTWIQKSREARYVEISGDGARGCYVRGRWALRHPWWSVLRDRFRLAVSTRAHTLHQWRLHTVQVATFRNDKRTSVFSKIRTLRGYNYRWLYSPWPKVWSSWLRKINLQI